MTSAQTPGLIGLALNDGQAPSAPPPFGRLFALSLTLHAAFLLVAGTVQFPGVVQRPLVTHEITIVTMLPESRPAVKPAPVPQRPDRAAAPKPKPVTRPAAPRPEPVPARLSAPPPAPPVTRQPAPVIEEVPAERPPDPMDEAKVRSETLMQEALNKIRLPARPLPDSARAPAPEASRPRRPVPLQAAKATPPPSAEPDARAEARLRETLDRIELPPEAPRFQSLAPAPVPPPSPSLPVPRVRAPQAPPRAAARPTPSPELQREIQSVLKKLDVPDMPRSASVPPPTPPVAVPERVPRASLTQDLKKELDELERRLQAERAAEPPASRSTTAPAEPPAPSSASAPATSIRASGANPGASEYLTRVQTKISSHWVAPPVDLSGRPLSVVIKFRLHRSGSVSDLDVERTSGNAYYDLAAKRAVLSANPLPPFPEGMTERYLDTHFTFAVKTPAG